MSTSTQIVLLVVVAGGVFAAIAISRSKWRNRALRDAATSLGFAPDDIDRVTLPEVCLLSVGYYGTYNNVLRGKAAGYEAILFDYSYEDVRGRFGQTAIAFHLPGADLPDFQVLPRPLAGKTVRAQGLTEIYLAHPEFAERFVVRGTEAAATAFFTPEMLDFLAGRSDNTYALEGYHEWVIVYAPHRRVWPGKFRQFVDETTRIAAGVLSRVPPRFAEKAGE
jgi:hypothetical protein